MLELITASGQRLDMYDDISFTITLKNPIFQKSLESSYIYDVNLPLTTHNKKLLLNFSNRLTSINKYTDVKVGVFFNGLKMFEGTFVYTGGVNTISGSIAIGQGEFLYYAFKRYLNGLDYGIQTYASASSAFSHFTWDVDKIYPEVNFSLPFMKGRGVDDLFTYLPEDTPGIYLPNYMNFWDPEGGGGYEYVIGEEKYIAIPQLYLNYVLDKLFNHYGYRVSESYLKNDAAYNRLMLFNLYNAHGGIPDDGEAEGYTADIRKIYWSKHVPMVLISDFISGLQNLLNIRFVFEPQSNSIKIFDTLDVIRRSEYRDISSLVKRFTDKKNISEGYSIKFSPDGSDAYYAHSIDWEKNRESEFGGELDTLTELPQYYMGFKFYYVKEINKFYEWNIIDEDWDEIPYLLKTKFIRPNQEFSIDSVVSPLTEDIIRPDLPATAFGNSAYNFRNVPPRLHFYCGRVLSYDGNTYPISRSYFGNKALEFHRQHAEAENRWKLYTDTLLQTKAISAIAMFDAATIKNFDFMMKYRIDGVNFFIKQIKVPINKYKIGNSVIDAVKV